ncbi:N-acetylglucosamine-6-phosphate deacetylase [Paenibacillus solanacearum]|uniref:N-acetylglucosamine-6-phosphate deacetylase n=1 Tax=Paenibacillus solanacearum TaxID=2048548 RepID=A0A916JRZ2_9BACL|nr:N-acetylglucosamine-6-phosphate deacetylase [Paenibacillus solanacearum]
MPVGEPVSVKGKHYRTGQPVEITMEDGRITGVLPWTADKPADDIPWIGPGLVDLQLNGYRAMDFNAHPIPSGTTHNVTRALWNEGVTAYYPTVITGSDERIASAVAAIASEAEEDPVTKSCVAGIHLEGPFISPEDGARGAHDKAYVKAPDWDLMQRWQEAARGLIRIVTVSPEWPEAPDFIRRCADAGIVVSVGHTNATPEQIRSAAEAGATMVTHFGNGAHPVLPRHPNYLWEQLASDPLWACVIADGFHLPDAVLKVVRKVKEERMLLVSDAVSLSGMPPGAYDMPVGGQVVLTEEGRLHLAHDPRLLAGSAQLLPWGISHLIRKGICDLADAWDAASVHPAAKLGLPSAKGLQAGAPADVAVMEWDGRFLRPAAVYKAGVKRYG